MVLERTYFTFTKTKFSFQNATEKPSEYNKTPQNNLWSLQ